MAGSQHTQTRPEFTWLFLAVPKHLPHGKPVVLRTTAATEEEARAEFCGWNMVFAAKIRSQMRCHITFYDDVNRTGLTLEVEAVEGCSMPKSKWSEIDIEDELRRLEVMLCTTLYMNLDDEEGYSIAIGLISMSLSRVRELKAVSEVSHA